LAAPLWSLAALSRLLAALRRSLPVASLSGTAAPGPAASGSSPASRAGLLGPLVAVLLAFLAAPAALLSAADRLAPLPALLVALLTSLTALL